MALAALDSNVFSGLLSEVGSDKTGGDAFLGIRQGEEPVYGVHKSATHMY